MRYGRALRWLACLAVACGVVSHTGLANGEQIETRLAYLFQALDQRQVEPRLWLVFAKDPLPRTRLEAVRVLASVADPDTVRVLAEFASDPDDRVRQLVMLAAGRTGVAATGLVTRGLADDSPAVRQGAMWAAAQLGDDGWEIIVPRLESERDPLVIETLLGNISSFGDRPWRDVAARFARSANPNLRRAVAAGLARAGGDDSLEVLARDPEPVIRATAVSGFGRGPWTPAYQQIVLAAARDADWRVRAAAFGVLAARPNLVLSDADRAVISGAVMSQHAQERVPAIRAAAVQKGVMSVADLMAVTKSDGPWAASEALVAATAVDATTALPEVARWAKSQQTWRRRAAARAVAVGADGFGEDAAALVEVVTKDAEPSVRLAWLEGLQPRGVVSREATLNQLVSEDPDPMVRAAVIDVLRGADRLGDSKRWLGFVARWRGDEAPDARAAAYAAALVATAAPEERAPILERAMSDPDDGVRCLVAEAARGLGIPVVAPPRDARHGAPWYRDLAHWVAEPHWLDIVTVRGTFRIRLDAADAPLSAREIFDLAASGRYDGLDVHRVVPNFVVQGGDPRGDGWGGPGFTLADEPSLVPFDSGSVGIATGGRHTGGSQLFAMLLPADRLTGHYTHLGEVVAGRDVLERLEVGDRILRIETSSGRPLPQPTRMLIGDLTWDAVVEHTGWSVDSDGDDLDIAAITLLASAIGHYRVVAVFGSWCGDSARELPRLHRVLDRVDNDRFSLRLVGVDRSKRVPLGDAELQRVVPDGAVDKVPTIFVLDADGAELGRIVETADAPIEQLLVDFLAPVEGW